MSISLDLRYHLQEIDDPEEAWDKIESVFVKLNIIRSQQLEDQNWPWVQMIFLALETIYLGLKHSEFYVKNVR